MEGVRLREHGEPQAPTAARTASAIFRCRADPRLHALCLGDEQRLTEREEERHRRGIGGPPSAWSWRSSGRRPGPGSRAAARRACPRPSSRRRWPRALPGQQSTSGPHEGHVHSQLSTFTSSPPMEVMPSMITSAPAFFAIFADLGRGVPDARRGLVVDEGNQLRAACECLLQPGQVERCAPLAVQHLHRAVSAARSFPIAPRTCRSPGTRSSGLPRKFPMAASMAAVPDPERRRGHSWSEVQAEHADNVSIHRPELGARWLMACGASRNAPAPASAPARESSGDFPFPWGISGSLWAVGEKRVTVDISYPQAIVCRRNRSGKSLPEGPRDGQPDSAIAVTISRSIDDALVVQLLARNLANLPAPAPSPVSVPAAPP